MSNRVEFLKDCIMTCMRTCLKMFFIFPIKKNRVFFDSYLGKQYTCNPKYIYQELLKQPEPYEIIWHFEDPEKFSFLKKDGVKLVKSYSLKFWYYRLTAQVTVTNVIWRNITPIRRGQYEIQTWHGGGGGYKKSLADDKEQQANKFALKRHMKSFKRFSLVLTSSATSLYTNARMAMQYDGIVLGGTPRNDILINQNCPELNEKVRKFFNLDSDVKIALYAPTWRSDAVKEDFDIDYQLLKESLEMRFGGKWVILRRMHWMAAGFFEESSDDYIKAENYPDMQELLYVINVLVTDYSSSIWDFSFTKKPCFLLCFDLKKYKEDRDFYNPIHTWGFPVAESNAELAEKILHFDEAEYKKEMNYQHKKNSSFESGCAAQNVCKIIKSMCYGDGSLPAGLPYK